MEIVSKEPVRVRIAPSPTGLLHIGTARSALFNWLFARNQGGTFIVRIEDTDEERSSPEFEKMLIEGLHWLGIDWDEGPVLEMRNEKLEIRYKGPHAPYRQSERRAVYDEYLQKLLKENKAYFCYCTKEELAAEKQALEAEGLPPKYLGHCRNLTAPPPGRASQTVRFRTSASPVRFKDIIRGTVEFDAALFGDFIIARSSGSVLHHLAVTVDDALMNITHVIRGEDLLSNTPRQILLQRALGFPEPVYAHLPLILNPDRSKLSKRKNDVSLLAYRDEGYLPEAMVNFMALLGWHPKDDHELLTQDELIQLFDLKRVQKAGAVFNIEKLEWLNGEYLRQLSLDELAARVEPFLERAGIRTEHTFLLSVLKTERERMKTLADIITVAGFFFRPKDYEPKMLAWKTDEAGKTMDVLEALLAIVKTLPASDFSGASIGKALETLVEKEGRGSVLWPLRVALSGEKASPDPLAIAEVLGKTESLRRIEAAITRFKQYHGTT